LLIRARERAGAGLRSGVLISFVSLLAVLPQSMLQGYSEYSFPGLLSRELNPQAYSSFALTVGLIGIALNPVMLFILMYVIGRSLDLKEEYAMAASCLFLGALVGELAGRATVFLAFPISGDSFTIMTSIAVESVSSAVSAIFVGFTGAAIAFIRRPGAAGEGIQDSPEP